MPIRYIPHTIRATKTDQTGARAFATNYTNNTLRPIQAVITVRHQVNLLNSQLYVVFSSGGLDSARSGYFNTPAVGVQMDSCLVGNIAPGEVYNLVNVAAGGVNTIVRWIEVAQ